MIASTPFGRLTRQVLIGIAIVGMLAAALGGIHQTRGFADASQAVTSAVAGAASVAIDDEDASARTCLNGRDRHYGYYVCTFYPDLYAGNGWYWGSVYVYGVGLRYLKYYDYLYSPNIYIR